MDKQKYFCFWFHPFLCRMPLRGRMIARWIRQPDGSVLIIE